jgi:hypothetical protein
LAYVAGGRIDLQGSIGGALVAGGPVHLEKSRIGILIPQGDLKLDESSQVSKTFEKALVFGAALGAALALVSVVLRFLLGRER